MDKLSIVIPVFNKLNFTLSCLNDLSKLDMNKNEIIVIDNASSDGTKEAIRSDKYDFVRYIGNEDNLGFSKACNIAYRASTGNAVMFLNNDIRVNSNHDTWTDIIFNTLKDNENSLVGPTGGMIDVKNDFQFLYEAGNENKPINYMSGWCLSAYKKTFDKLLFNGYPGPFSEEYKFYFEDTDMGFRAAELEIPFKLVDIPVVHFGKITSRQINVHKLYTESRKVFSAKWSKKFTK